MIYDKDAILADANAIDVAEAIGMDIKRCGSTLYTNCVSGEHEESHIAHNQLFSTGCYCYTCGKRYDTVEMVRNYFSNVIGNPVSFPKALEIIADTCGGIDKYILKDVGKKNWKKEKKELPFSQEELEAIGLLSKKKPGSDRVIVYSTDKKDNDLIRKYDEKHDTYYYIKTKKGNSITLMNLYEDDPKAFIYLCHAKAAEELQKYNDIIKKCSSLLGHGNNEFIINLGAVICEKMDLCKNVLKKTASESRMKIFSLS